MKATRLRELCDAAVKYSATVAADGPHHHERVSDVFDLAAAAREYAAAPALPEILSALEQAERALKPLAGQADDIDAGCVDAWAALYKDDAMALVRVGYLRAASRARAALREVMGGDDG